MPEFTTPAVGSSRRDPIHGPGSAPPLRPRVGRRWARGLCQPLGEGSSPPRHGLPDGDLVHLASTATVSRGGGVLDAAPPPLTAGLPTCASSSPERKRRPLHRPGAHPQRAPVLLIDRDADGERVGKVPDAAWCRPTPATERAHRGRVADCDVVVRPPGTTRPTSSCRCSPRPSSASPDGRPGQQPQERVDVRRAGAWTSPSRPASHDRTHRGGGLRG